MWRKGCLLMLCCLTFSFAFEPGVRLAWDFKTLKKIYGKYSFYPRMIRLQNGDLLCAFENWAQINDQIVASVLVGHSSDDGKSWSEPVKVVQTENGVNPAVPDLIQLSNGYVLLAYNPRPPKDNVDVEKRFAIRTAVSMDHGRHWLPWSRVYTASYLFDDGCWEPAPLQLPTGEVQLYMANEFPYPNSNEQEITMLRSFDYGYTWSDTVTVSFREGHRDGMPVPLLLQNEQGIAVAIEDNGWGDGQFKPTIVWSSFEDNWHSGTVMAQSPRRWRALKAAFRIPDGEIGAAPYLAQLPSGEVLLSYQGTEGQHPSGNPDWRKVAMFTAIGDAQAKNFSRKSKPFNIRPERTAMWNSLFVKNEHTVTALTSTTNFSSEGASEIYVIDGYVLSEPQAPFVENITLDGRLTEAVWQKADSLLIGAYSKTQVWLKMVWQPGALIVGGRCSDSSLWADDADLENDDGITIYFDVQNKNSQQPQGGLYRLQVDVSGQVICSEGTEEGKWESLFDDGVVARFNLRGTLNQTAPDSGYQFELQIPWTLIGGKPEAGRRWGVHFVLRDDQNGGAFEHSEAFSGGESHKPFTWWCAQLMDSVTALPEEMPERYGQSPVDFFRVFPNPFNTTTQITYTLNKSNRVLLEIYDYLGRRVNVLSDGFQNAGCYEQQWTVQNPKASGIYFCRLSVGNFKRVKKLVVIK
ncbi:T9SS type A sorting domain-containing protein [Caldithrix abyssi]